MAIGLVGGGDESGRIWVTLLYSPDPKFNFTRKLLKPEKTWGSYGTDWVLELIPGPSTGRQMGRVAEKPGVVTVTSNDKIMALGLEDDVVLHLESLEVDSAMDYFGLIFSSWRVWASEAHRSETGAMPLIDWQLANLDAIIAG